MSKSQSSTPSQSLTELIDKSVCLITNDGRSLIGTLLAFDQTINVVLSNAIERVYSSDKPVSQTPLGLYLIRGDNIAVVGEFDEQKDSLLDLNAIRAEPLKPVTH